jgi:hypothetical protein
MQDSENREHNHRVHWDLLSCLPPLNVSASPIVIVHNNHQYCKTSPPNSTLRKSELQFLKQYFASCNLQELLQTYLEKCKQRDTTCNQECAQVLSYCVVHSIYKCSQKHHYDIIPYRPQTHNKLHISIDKFSNY